jgi:carbon-monoxide dehydrogenase medium subunit
MISAAGEDARFIAGGQSLVPMMNFRIARPVALVDLNDCADLDYARAEDGRLRIGAMMRQRAAENDETIRRHCPLAAAALAQAGPATVRNRATVGGTIANGYPVAELPVVAVCLDAEITLRSANGERRVPAAEFFVMGMVTAIEPTQLLTEVAFPSAGAASCFGFAECGNHAGGEALAIAAACGERGEGDLLDKVKIAAAGLQSIPVRLPAVEAAVMTRGSVEAAFAADLATLEASANGLEADGGQRDLVCRVVEDAVAQMRRAGATA